MKIKNTEKSYIFPANADAILKDKEPGTYYFSLVDRPVMKDSSGRVISSVTVLELKFITKDKEIGKRDFDIIDDHFVPQSYIHEVSLKNCSFSSLKQIAMTYEEYGLDKPIYNKLTPLITTDLRFHSDMDFQKIKTTLQKATLGTYFFYSNSLSVFDMSDCLVLAYKGAEGVFTGKYIVLEYQNQTEIYQFNPKKNSIIEKKFVNLEEVISFFNKLNLNKLELNKPVNRQVLNYPSDTQQPFFDQLPEDVKKLTFSFSDEEGWPLYSRVAKNWRSFFWPKMMNKKLKGELETRREIFQKHPATVQIAMTGEFMQGLTDLFEIACLTKNFPLMLEILKQKIDSYISRIALAKAFKEAYRANNEQLLTILFPLVKSRWFLPSVIARSILLLAVAREDIEFVKKLILDLNVRIFIEGQYLEEGKADLANFKKSINSLSIYKEEMSNIIEARYIIDCAEARFLMIFVNKINREEWSKSFHELLAKSLKLYPSLVIHYCKNVLEKSVIQDKTVRPYFNSSPYNFLCLGSKEDAKEYPQKKIDIFMEEFLKLPFLLQLRDSELLLQLAKEYEARDDKSKALQFYEETIKIGGPNVEAANGRARCSEEQSNCTFS